MAKSRTSRKQRILLASLAVLVTAPLLGIWIVKVRSERAWTAFVNRWEARGEKFELAPHLPPEVPPHQNLAHHPLFRETPSSPGDPPPSFRRILPETLPGWNEDAYYDRASDEDLRDAAPWFGLPPGTPVADVQSKLGDPYQEWSNQLDTFAAALAQRPGLDLEVDWAELFVSADVPDLEPYHTLGRILLIRAAVRRATGDGPGAARDLGATLQLVRAFSGTPLLLTCVYQSGLLAEVIAELRVGLQDDLFSASELEFLATALNRTALPSEGLLRALRVERALLLAFLDLLETNRNSAALRALGVPDGRAGPGYFLVKLWMPANRLAVCQDQQEFFLGPGGRYRDLAPWRAAVRKRLGDRIEQLVAPVGHLILATFGGGTDIAGALFATETDLQHARLAFALERSRLARGGAYPAALSELVPKFLPTLPVSTFDHSPIRYAIRLDGSWRLSQAGPDETTIQWESHPQGPHKPTH